MAKRRRGLGNPIGIRRLRIGGYPKKVAGGGWVLQDGAAKTIARGRLVGCTKIKPGAPGSWISNERCSFQFKVPDAGKGKWYSCRGFGEGMAASCRRMKNPPRDVRGVSRYG